MVSLDDEIASSAEAHSARSALADIEIRKLRAQVRDEAAKARHLAQLLDEANGRAAFVEHLRSSQPTHVALTSSGLGSYVACPVIMCSDWHAEERVDPATVNGRNAYDPEIFEARVLSLTRGVLWHVEHAAWDVDDAVLWLGGDLITGYIHEELMEANYLSPTHAVLLVQDAVCRMIASILAHGRVKRLRVICNDGNHGRTTPRTRIQTRTENSYEWLMYQQLARLHASDERIEWTIASGTHVYVDVYGTRIRFLHGDECSYHGGVGGIGIPLRKAVDAWNSNMRADMNVMGHWHQLCTPHPDIIVNGSLIGWGPFAQSIKARFERPRQGLFFVSERWGVRGLEPIYVDE